jgi:hypothetical protein
MIVDLSPADLALLHKALTALQDHDGSDDHADELQGRIQRHLQEAPQNLAKLQQHLATYFQLTQPLPESQRPVPMRLQVEAAAHAAAINTAEALMFCSPLWKLIREWKA